MEPDLYDIGANADEARGLLEIHNHLCEKLVVKQDQISQLLSRADDLVTQQTSESQTQVYAAMAESLNRAWRDLLGVLTQRGHLLELAVECYSSAEDAVTQAQHVETVCNNAGWGHDVTSVQRLIDEHEALKNACLIEPSHRMLNAANALLDLLGRLSNQAGPSGSCSATSVAARASVEARERIAAVTAKGGAARRHAELVWNRRDRLLQLRLAVISMEAELERIVDWFVKELIRPVFLFSQSATKVGEPRLSENQLGTSLSECQSHLENLMALIEEVQEMQNMHTRLMRHLQQASSTQQRPTAPLRTVFETLETEQQQLETELRQAYTQYGLLEREEELDDAHMDNEVTWKETHGAYAQLSSRMRTTEAYIWEFLDRIEHRRRQLHTGVIYYSECNVLLKQIYQLEADMKQTHEYPPSGLEDSFFERLNDLEVRVPGLRQTLSDLRSIQDDSFAQSSLRTQIGVTPSVVALDHGVSSVPINAATNKLKEIEDGIARCRLLFSAYQERSMKAQKRQEVYTRIEMLSEWLNQRIERALVEHACMGTTTEHVADFEDFYRRLEKELESREPELDEVRAAVNRMSPSSEKASLEIRFNNLNSQWDRSRQAIRVRLTLADKFLAVLRRIREDEYQQNLLLERMHQLEGIDTSVTSSDLAGSVGMEGPDKLRSEVTLTISRLEDQQTLLRDYIDQVTQRADRDLNTAEPVRYCQLQLELNARRLEQLRESWVGCERFWEQWKMAREYWLAFNEDARRLDDSMAASLSRMSHAPLPNKPVECDRAMREHHKEREDIDHLSSVVLSRAAQLGSMIGVRPDDRAEDGRGWRLTEIPVGPETGLPASALGRRVRSELALQLAGLETRWSAWDKAWTTRRIQLERRGLQVGRLSTIEVSLLRNDLVFSSLYMLGAFSACSAYHQTGIRNKISMPLSCSTTSQLSKFNDSNYIIFVFFKELEGEVAVAEDNLQTISKKVSVQAPLEQVEQAERDLNQLEATIPVLQTRVRSTAPGLRMELIHGEPCDTSLSELPFDVTDRYQQLSTRFEKLADSTTRCRVELNLTLRLLRAVKVADNALSQLTISLDGAKKRIHEIPPEDRVATQQFRSEIEEQLVRGQALADMHIPTLEQLAAQHPRTVEARERIQPTVLGFVSTIDELQRVSNEIRIRSEQSVYLIRPTGTSLDSDTTTTRLISPASPRPSGPVITKPLRNMFTDEGITVLLTTEFQSGLPQDANPYDQQQLQAIWFKDGQQVVTPDYEPRLTPTTAELRIGETLSEDTGLFTCCIRTPYGQAETSCNLVVNETHSPVSTRPVADESAVRPSKRARSSRPPGHMTGPPRFVRELTNQTIREPEELNLQCQAVGEPVPQLQWFKDGTSIQANPDYMITELAGAGSVKVSFTESLDQKTVINLYMLRPKLHHK
ncbi:immunoglobulin I-set domain protein [Opisthorchis viverrini]|uniref:Immunoglobulin I-set domain protein n=1 Tax=Opisthorchis viverrini TaxID=6198 RepID=A0A1S8WI89_OPIVI|nr:immunoglobulin I-set domain protein [Opisthorchis viverrini]